MSEYAMEFHEVAKLFPLIEGQEFDELVKDIRENGLQQPIWTHQGKIIDGRNRYRACLCSGVAPRYQEWDGNGSLVAFAVSLNVKRRHLTSSQLAVIALATEKQLAKEAQEEEEKRKSVTTLQKIGKSPLDLQEKSQIHASKQAAQLLSTNHEYVSTAKRIEREAPELLPHIIEGTLTIPDAKAIAELPQTSRAKVVEKAVQRKEEEGKRVSSAVREAIWEEEERDRHAKVEHILQGIRHRHVDLPTDRYRCLVVDPPWQMQKIERDVRPNQVGFDYPTMSEEELQAFPLPGVAADDCHLYLWTTQKHLPIALRLAQHWGFKYQCLMTWVKNVGFTPFSWMYSTEHVLFCTKGGLSLLKLGKRLDFTGKVREHSRKPDEFYDIVREVSPGPRIDIFSREKREGFEQYGNEVEKFVVRA